MSTGEATLVEGPVSTIQANETEMSLGPADTTVDDEPGTYLFRAVNVGNVTHALWIEEQRTRDAGPGESADLPVTLSAGTYEIDRPAGNREDLGMRGTVTVEEGRRYYRGVIRKRAFTLRALLSKGGKG